MSNNANTDYIIELLRCAVNDDTPALPPADVDWKFIFKLSHMHHIEPTLFFGIQKLPGSVKESIKYYKHYNLMYKKNLVLDANRTFEIQKLSAEFDKCGIDYIFLKGSVTKYLYPDTSMRVMSDIDIFFRMPDGDFLDYTDINNIFIQNSYTAVKTQPKEVVYIKNGSDIRIEMQSQLIDRGYSDWFDYLSNIWDKCKLVRNNSHEYKMTDEDVYIYHIIHLAKHFKLGGIGLIHILDVYIMVNAWPNLDWEYINSQFSALGLLTFDRNVRSLASMWFGNVTPDEKIQPTLNLMCDYIFQSGAFGSKSQEEINIIVERNDSSFSVFKKIFPDKDRMVNYYGDILLKHRFLIPFYWVRLNFERLVIRRKDLKDNLESMRSISDTQIEKTKELMEHCGF